MYKCMPLYVYRELAFEKGLAIEKLEIFWETASFSILCKGLGILLVMETSEKFLEGPEGKEVSDFSGSNEEPPKLGE